MFDEGKIPAADLTMAAFGRLCEVDEQYYSNMEGGKIAGPPGRRLLEKAARHAGYDLAQCLHLPVKPKTEFDDALEIFQDALRDKRCAPQALLAAAKLAGMLREKQKKKGGRTRKPA